MSRKEWAEIFQTYVDKETRKFHHQLSRAKIIDRFSFEPR